MKTSVWMSFGIHAGTTPEGGGFVVKEVDVDQPLELGHGLAGLVGVGPGTGRVLAPGEESVEFSFVHLVKDHQP